MQVILVTGAAGFIGCNFVRMLINRYPAAQVISFDKLTYAGSLTNLADVLACKNHIFVQGDICDAAHIAGLLRQYQINTIVHFAAESHVDNSIADPEIFVRTNVLGTFQLLEAARKFWLEENNWNASQCRFHHISTDEVFGSLAKDDPPFTETTRYAPNSPYSASKAGSDHLARAYFHTYQLPVTISNCSNNYGPYQHAEKFLPTVIRACTEGRPIPIYGDGSNIRDWLYVEDHCDAVDLILQQGRVGETYNIGGQNEMSNLELAKRICAIMDERLPEYAPHARLIKFVTDRKGHDWRYAIQNDKICRELGWHLLGDIESRLAKTVGFYIANKQQRENHAIKMA